MKKKRPVVVRCAPIWGGYEKFDNLAKNVLSEIIKPGMTGLDELKAIYTWIAENIDYGRVTPYLTQDDFGECNEKERKVPKGMENWYSEAYYHELYIAMTTKKAWNQEYATLFEALAAARGFKTTIFSGMFDHRSLHMVSAVWLDGSWKLVDCDSASNRRPISFKYFLKKSFSYFELSDEFDLSNSDHGLFQSYAKWISQQ